MNGHGLRGLVGQGMNGRRRFVSDLVGFVNADTGSGSITAPMECTALVYIWGGGGSGEASATGGGGGGGAAAYKAVQLGAGDTITWSVGAGGVWSGTAFGGSTTISFSRGLAPMTAGGGGQGGNGLGGTASGGDLNRRGGDGGAQGAGAAGSAGESGAAGAAASGTLSGGGGAAGFSELLFTSGAGSAGNTTTGGGTPGGGSGAHATTPGNGGNGRATILLVRTRPL